MRTRRLILVTLVVSCCMAWISAYGADETKVKGLITGRTSDSMTVRVADGSTTTVMLTDDTKVLVPKGLGLRHTKVSWTELIPGLKVEVKGTNNPQGQLVASQINFNKQDLQTASMIQAGLQPTEQRVDVNQQNIAANKQDIAANKGDIAANKEAIATNTTQIDANEKATNDRFKNLTDYDVKKDLVINFPVNVSKLAAADKASLNDLVASTKGLQGYIIQVQGYCDASGNMAFNQTLSRDRAEAVINYLMQVGNVSPRHILAPGAMGIADPKASNETAAGRAENRRVEVKVLMNKGLQNPS